MVVRLKERRVERPFANGEKAGVRVDGLGSGETENGAVRCASGVSVTKNRAVNMAVVRRHERPGCANLQILLR